MKSTKSDTSLPVQGVTSEDEPVSDEEYDEDRLPLPNVDPKEKISEDISRLVDINI